MKTVRVQISSENFDKYVEYDNVVSREEIIHEILSKNPVFNEARGETNREKENWDKAVYITWFDGDSEQARTEAKSREKKVEDKPREKKVEDKTEETDAG